MKSSSGFYKSLGWLLFLNLLIKPIWIFGIDRQVQNHVGYAEYGSYFSLLSFSLLFSFLLDWGFTIYFNRQVAMQKETEYHTGKFLAFKILLLLSYVCIVCVAAFIISISDWAILFYIIIIQVLSSLFLFLRAMVTGRQQFHTDAWLSVLDKSLMILLCGSFLVLPATGTITLEIFLQAQVVCTIIANLVALLILRQNRSRLYLKAAFPTRNLILAALPFALIVLLMSAHYRLDGFLLQQIRGEEEAGSYAAAYRLLDAANMPGFLIASFLLPFLVRNSDSTAIVRSAVLFCRHLLFPFSLLISVSTLFLAGWGQQILYNNNDTGAIELLQYCLPVIIAYSVIHIYGTVLTAYGYVYEFCLITLVAVLINIILNILLIPSMGAKGSAIAALVSQGICGLITFIYASKKCTISFDVRSFGLYIFIGMMLAGCFYFLGRLNLHPVLQLLTAVLLLATCWITWLKPNSIKNLFPSNQ